MMRLLFACACFALVACNDRSPGGDFSVCDYPDFLDAGPGGCRPQGLTSLCPRGDYAIECGSVGTGVTVSLPKGCVGGYTPGATYSGCCPCE